MQIQTQGLVLGKFREHLAEGWGRRTFVKVPVLLVLIEMLFLFCFYQAPKHTTLAKQRRHWQVNATVFSNPCVLHQNHASFDSIKNLP